MNLRLLKTILGLAALGTVAAAGPASAPAGIDTYEIDNSHSSIIFRIKHMGVSYTYGRFNDISGHIGWDSTAPTQSTIRVEVKIAGIDTNDNKRDKHLKSNDFFNATEFPKASFQSKSLKSTGENLYEMTGDMTILGVTRPITVPLEWVGSIQDPDHGDRIGLECTFTLKRSDFGMTTYTEHLADDVRITVSLEGVRIKK